MITNNENIYAIYTSDGILSGFQENNYNNVSKIKSSQTIAGGESNSITGNYSNIIGGYNNSIKSNFATILAGRNSIITQDGSTILADGSNRTHYSDQADSLTIDYNNGIYLKNQYSATSGNASNGTFGKIDLGPQLKISSYIAGPQYDNIPSAQNYYPATSTSLTLQTNNWLKTNNYPLERTDSISYITLGANGIKLAGVNANSQKDNYNQSGIYSTASIDLNQDITIETAKDGNSINLISDYDINLQGYDVYIGKSNNRVNLIDGYFIGQTYIPGGVYITGERILLNNLSIIERTENIALNITGILV